MSIGPAIGIDLRTASLCVGGFHHGKVENTANDQSDRTKPSYVALTHNERRISDVLKIRIKSA